MLMPANLDATASALATVLFTRRISSSQAEELLARHWGLVAKAAGVAAPTMAEKQLAVDKLRALEEVVA
jgi:hypothetical protein